MDPPQEGEEPLALARGVVGEVAARLGFTGVGVGVGEEGLELMEHLGLGEGTRIVDLQVCLSFFFFLSKSFLMVLIISLLLFSLVKSGRSSAWDRRTFPPGITFLYQPIPFPSSFASPFPIAFAFPIHPSPSSSSRTHTRTEHYPHPHLSATSSS